MHRMQAWAMCAIVDLLAMCAQYYAMTNGDEGHHSEANLIFWPREDALS